MAKIERGHDYRVGVKWRCKMMRVWSGPTGKVRCGVKPEGCMWNVVVVLVVAVVAFDPHPHSHHHKFSCVCTLPIYIIYTHIYARPTRICIYTTYTHKYV